MYKNVLISGERTSKLTDVLTERAPISTLWKTSALWQSGVSAPWHWTSQGWTSSNLRWTFQPVQGVLPHWCMIHRAHTYLTRSFRRSCHGLFNLTLGTRHKGSIHSCETPPVNAPYGCSFQANPTTAACRGWSGTARSLWTETTHAAALTLTNASSSSGTRNIFFFSPQGNNVIRKWTRIPSGHV